MAQLAADAPDLVAEATLECADAVALARGLMISVGCIQAQRCHSNTCPVGVATTDEGLMGALVVEEKQWRVRVSGCSRANPGCGPGVSVPVPGAGRPGGLSVGAY